MIQQVVPEYLKKQSTPQERIDEEIVKEEKINFELKRKQDLQELHQENIELSREVNGDVIIATSDVSEIRQQTVDPLGTSINRNKEAAPNTMSVHDIHKTWVEENGDLLIGSILFFAIIIFLLRRKS